MPVNVTVSLSACLRAYEQEKPPMRHRQAGDTPAPRPVRIASVKAPLPLVVRFLGKYRGMLTHWPRNRSVPCLGPSKCPASLHSKYRLIWKGYAPCLEWVPSEGLWLPAVAEITELLEERLHGLDLRGQVWYLEREDPTNNESPIKGTCIEENGDNPGPAEFDVRPVLMRFYHVTDLVLDVPNPMPPRLMMEPVEAGPPVELQPLVVEPAKGFTDEQRASFHEQLRKAGFRIGAHKDTTATANGNGKGVDHV